MKRIFFLLFVIILRTTGLHAAEKPCLMSDMGHFRIHVGTSGLFGVFAHNHLIEAKGISGCATIDSTDIRKSSISVNFETNAIRVIDPKESAEDRAKVQKTMKTEVLRVADFPTVTFQSTTIEPAGRSDEFLVHGNLTIRGKAQPVAIPVKLTHDSAGLYRVTGQHKLKQTSFGIQPVQLAAGTVKVKDELEVDFELFLK